MEFEEDTASAAMLVAESGDLSRGAIASEEAATRYGLQVLKRSVANQKEVYTRFVVIARQPRTADARLPHKTSLLATIKHSEGSLAKALDVLAQHKVNLTKLESRPSPERPWQYLFYMDFEGGVHKPQVAEAMKELAQHAEAVRVLGSYPRSVVGSANQVQYLPVARGSSGNAPSPNAKGAPATKENKSYRLASRGHHAGDTVVDIKNVRIGGDAPFVLSPGRARSSRANRSPPARAPCTRPVVICSAAVVSNRALRPTVSRASASKASRLCAKPTRFKSARATCRTLPS